ncbi:MAG: tetratricopeptide repeat protein, partial [Planctomycetaceae bacterium]
MTPVDPARNPPLNLPVPVVPTQDTPVANATRPLSQGELLADRYEIRRVLSNQTFIALDRVAQREVRIVVLTQEQLARLKPVLGIPASPNLTTILDLLTTARGSFGVVELPDGESLRTIREHRNAAEQRFSVDEVRRWGLELAEVLESLVRRQQPVCLNLDTVHLTSDGRARLSETALIQAGSSDSRDVLRQLATLLYELLSGISPTSRALPLDQIRNQIPRPLAQVIQRGLGTPSSRSIKSLSAFRRGLAVRSKANSPLVSLLVAGLMSAVVFASVAIWWATRPVPSKITKADYAQRLGTVQQMVERANQQDKELLDAAKSARGELEKWQKEVNSAREENKQVQLEYAEQHLAEIRPAAEMQIRLGELWQNHRERTAWQSEATGQLTAAQSLAEDLQFESAVERLMDSENLLTSWIGWKSTATETLTQLRAVQEMIQQQRPTATDIAYVWPTRQLDSIDDQLQAGDGHDALSVVEEVRQSLRVIEELVALRTSVMDAIQQTEQLIEIQQVREQREAQVALVQQADQQLQRGDFEPCRSNYTLAQNALAELPAQALQLLLESARKSRESGKTDAAWTMLEQAVALELDSAEAKKVQAEAYSLRAEIRVERQELQAAVEDCTRALELDPQSTLILCQRAVLQNDLKLFDQAFSDCEAVLVHDAGSEPARMERGIAHYGRREFTQSLADLEFVLVKRPDNRRALAYRGLVRLELGELESSISDLGKVLEEQPDHVVALTGRARAYRKRGDLAEAIQDCDRLLRIEPRSWAGHWLRGASLYDLGQIDEAIANLVQAAEIDERDTEALVMLARIRNQRQDWTGAEEHCEQALKRDGACEAARYERGIARTGTGNMEGARTDFNQLLSLNPQHLPSLVARGDVYFQLHQLAESQKDYERVIEVSPENPQALVGRAAVCVAQGEFERAIIDCDLVLEKQPETLRAYRIRAVANFKLGKFSETIADCTSAAKLDDRA